MLVDGNKWPSLWMSLNEWVTDSLTQSLSSTTLINSRTKQWLPLWVITRGITWLTSRLILLRSIWNVVMVILKCPSKVCRQVFLYNCLPERSATTVFPNSWHSPPKARHLLICSLKVQVIYIYYIWQLLNKWLLLLFFVIFSSSLSGSDDFVISNSLDGNAAYSQMFYAINFAHNLNSQLRMETRLLSKTTYIWWRTYFGPRNDPELHC